MRVRCLGLLDVPLLRAECDVASVASTASGATSFATVCAAFATHVACALATASCRATIATPVCSTINAACAAACASAACASTIPTAVTATTLGFPCRAAVRAAVYASGDE